MVKLLSLFPLLCFLFLSVNAQRDPPFVVNVTDVTTSTPGGATYGINSLLEFEVEFTHPVQVSNSDFLRLKLNIWRDSVKAWAQAEYIEPSSAPNKLRFAYVVKRRDFTPDYLDYYRYDAISGGVIEPNVTLCASTGVGAVVKCPLLSSFLPPKGVASLATKKILVWGFPAFLVNVSTPTETGIYGIGSTINITLQYSAPVTVVRQRSEVNLPLNSDITAGQLVPASATYVAGSGTNTLTFQYTVQRGHYSYPLNYPEFATLKNIVIKDMNNEVDYNLPSPSASSLLGSKKINADGIPPYPAFVTSTAQYRSLFRPGEAVTVLVIFSEPIELFYFDKMQIILNIGVFPASGFSVDTVNFTFIVPNNTDTDELNYVGTTSIIPNGARVYDLARNEGSFILPPNNTEINLQGKNDYSPLGRLKIRISSTRPFFVGTQASTSGPLLPFTVFNIIIVVSENLQISGTTPGNPYLVLSDGGIANFTQSSSSGLVPGLIFTYTVPAKTTYLNIPLEIRAFVFDSTTASITNEAKLPLNATGINFQGPNLSLTSKITFVAAIGPPDAPINLTVSQVNFDSITIQWTRPSDNGARIFRYQIERSTGPDNFAIDGAVEVSASDFNTAYLYTAKRFLIPNQVYYFRVAAQNVVALSNYSNVVNATIVLDGK